MDLEVLSNTHDYFAETHLSDIILVEYEMLDCRFLAEKMSEDRTNSVIKVSAIAKIKSTELYLSRYQSIDQFDYHLAIQVGA